MHQFGLDNSVIEYVVDDNPLKQGLFSPGVGVPIVDSDYLKANVPDCIVILAWNFADSICEKLDWFTRGGGKILVPLPTLMVKG